MSVASNDEQALVAAAWQARQGAVCPHSGFAVGAALEDDTGRVWTGANVENDSFNLGMCAERVAIFHAVTHGGRGFRRVAIATDVATPAPPCGACRQILWELARDAEIILAGSNGALERTTVRELVPRGFEL